MRQPAVLGRSTRKTLAAALVAVGLVSTPALASGPSFTLIQPAAGFRNSYATSVADNGTVAGTNNVSTTSGQVDTPSFVWTEVGGRVDFLPPNSWRGGAPILSPDARYMAVSGVWSVYNSDTGNYRNGAYAYRRNPDGTFTSMPGIPPDTYHQPTGISVDGQRIVGYSGVQGYNNSWLWENGTTTLITIPGQPDFYTVSGISRDGSTIVGTKGFGTSTAFVRNGDGSYDVLPNATQSIYTQAYAVNADGSIVVGSNGGVPVVWRNKVPSLLDFPTALALGGGSASGVSDDGNVIVGSIGGSQGNPLQSFVWTASTGILTAADYIRLLGVQLPQSWLVDGVRVSGNGRYLCGEVWEPGGNFPVTAFRLEIPSPGAISLLAGVLTLAKRRR